MASETTLPHRFLESDQTTDYLHEWRNSSQQAVEPPLWASMRVPKFAVLLSAVPEESVGDLDSVVSSDEKTKFSSLRPIKKNAFQPTFLRVKPEKHVTDQRSKKHLCRTSILDLTRKAYNALSRWVPPYDARQKLRRSSAQRKKDWDVAISCLCQNDVKDAVSARYDWFPVLGTVLTIFDAEQFLDLNQLPLKAAAYPIPVIEIAPISSNMIFDMEVLKLIGHDGETILKPFFHDLSQEKDPLEALQPVGGDPSPIFDNLLLRWNKNILKSRPILDSIIQHGVFSLTSTCLDEMKVSRSPWSNSSILSCTHYEQLDPVLNRENDNALLEALKSCSTGNSPAREIQNWRKFDSIQLEERHMFSTDANNRSEASIESSGFMKYQAIQAAPIVGPVMQVRAPRQRFSVLDLGDVLLKKIKMTAKDALSCITQLWLPQKPVLNFERGIWSAATRQIMRRCKLKRAKTIHEVSHHRGAVLSEAPNRNLSHARSSIFKLKDIGSDKQLDMMLHVVQRNSSCFLPLKVDLEDGLRLSLHMESSAQVQPIAVHERSLHRDINTFDSPKGNRNPVLDEKILAMGRRTNGLLNGENRTLKKNRGISDRETIDHVESDESMLEEIIPSDEELPGAGETEIFDEMYIRGVERRSSTFVLDSMHPHIPPNEQKISEITKQRRPLLSAPENFLSTKHKGVNAEEQSRKPLPVPENLVCSSWMIRLAEKCVARMPRGTIIPPPSISVLPSLCIIINSHLCLRFQDQRIAIVCDSGEEVSRGVRSYLDYSFGFKVSIDIVRRADFPSEVGLPSLKGCSARIVILDSFDFSLPTGVTLLLALVCEPCMLRPQQQEKTSLVNQSISPHWLSTSSILVAPLDNWVHLCSYIEQAEQLSNVLNLSTTLFIPEHDDIHHSVLLTEPRALFLVPLGKAAEIVSLVDKQSLSLLPMLREFIHQPQSCQQENRNPANSLRDVPISLLRTSLDAAAGKKESELYRNLEVLYHLRQSRSYAICDGFEIAKAFLMYSVGELNPQSKCEIKQILQQIEGKGKDRNMLYDGDHPMIHPIINQMNEAKVSMKNEAPSLTSIHRRTVFRPLIIANSREAVNGFREGPTRAKLLFEAGEQEIAVCWSNDLLPLCGSRGISRYEKKVLRRLEEFSHIYHVVDDRECSHPEILLPAVVTQLVHVGRTRLITVIVDEDRVMESRWKSNKGLHRTMRKYIQDQRVFKDKEGEEDEKFWTLKSSILQHMMQSLW